MPVPAGHKMVRQLMFVNGVEADELTLAEVGRHSPVMSGYLSSCAVDAWKLASSRTNGDASPRNRASRVNFSRRANARRRAPAVCGYVQSLPRARGQEA